MPVGGTATGTFGTPIDTDGVKVQMVNGTTYQIGRSIRRIPGHRPVDR